MEKKIKKFAKIKIGQTAYHSPDAGGDWDDLAGEIIWKGSTSELKESSYKNMLEDFIDEDDNFDDEMIPDDYDWVVIDTTNTDVVMFGPILYNYNCDPSGVVVYKKKK